MSIMDKMEETQKLVRVYSTEKDGERVVFYEIRFSNLQNVAKIGLDFIAKDSRRYKKFVIIFNAKHIDSSKHFSTELYKTLDEYKALFLSDRLYKFAILVKGFIKHRMVINAFDRIYEGSKTKQEKYNYFSKIDIDKVREWLLE